MNRRNFVSSAVAFLGSLPVVGRLLAKPITTHYRYSFALEGDGLRSRMWVDGKLAVNVLTPISKTLDFPQSETLKVAFGSKGEHGTYVTTIDTGRCFEFRMGGGDPASSVP